MTEKSFSVGDHVMITKLKDSSLTRHLIGSTGVVTNLARVGRGDDVYYRYLVRIDGRKGLLPVDADEIKIHGEVFCSPANPSLK